MRVSGKVVFITGGGSGIGQALAERFAHEDARAVIVTDLDGDAANAVAGAIGGIPIELDVSDERMWREAVALVSDSCGGIDLLCLNAGIAVGGGPGAPDEAWQRSWAVNVMAHVYGARAVLPAMIERGGGYVLHTVSAAGLLTNIGAAPYAVTKHAALAFAEWLSVTYGDQGVGVSCLCPQFVATPLLREFEDMPGGRGLTSDSVVSTDVVVEAVVKGLEAEEFLILPHPEVLTFFRRKAEDYDRWLAGMRKLQGRYVETPPAPNAKS